MERELRWISGGLPASRSAGTVALSGLLEDSPSEEGAPTGDPRSGGQSQPLQGAGLERERCEGRCDQLKQRTIVVPGGIVILVGTHLPVVGTGHRERLDGVPALLCLQTAGMRFRRGGRGPGGWVRVRSQAQSTEGANDRDQKHELGYPIAHDEVPLPLLPASHAARGVPSRTDRQTASLINELRASNGRPSACTQLAGRLARERGNAFAG